MPPGELGRLNHDAVPAIITVQPSALAALLGLLTIGCLLYVTMSPEVEDAPKLKRPDTEQ